MPSPIEFNILGAVSTTRRPHSEWGVGREPKLAPRMQQGVSELKRLLAYGNHVPSPVSMVSTNVRVRQAEYGWLRGQSPAELVPPRCESAGLRPDAIILKGCRWGGRRFYRRARMRSRSGTNGLARLLLSFWTRWPIAAPADHAAMSPRRLVQGIDGKPVYFRRDADPLRTRPRRAPIHPGVGRRRIAAAPGSAATV